MKKLLSLYFLYFDLFIKYVFSECSYECPDLSDTMIPKPNYNASSNGCGSYGLTFNFDKKIKFEFNACCDIHDLCYGKCNSDKEDCDSEFYDCLFNRCDFDNLIKSKICKGVAKSMYNVVRRAGCKAFKSAQSKSCVCIDNGY